MPDDSRYIHYRPHGTELVFGLRARQRSRQRASWAPLRPDTARRGRLLYVALAFLGLDLPPAVQPSGLRALHAWLDTWHGIGLIAHRLPRQDRDLSLTRYRARWGATVFVTGMAGGGDLRPTNALRPRPKSRQRPYVRLW